MAHATSHIVLHVPYLVTSMEDTQPRHGLREVEMTCKIGVMCDTENVGYTFPRDKNVSWLLQPFPVIIELYPNLDLLLLVSGSFVFYDSR